MGSVATMTKPYRAAMEGKWDEVKSFYERHTERFQSPLTVNGDTILHISVYIRNMDLLKTIVDMLKSENMEFPIIDGEDSLFQVKDRHGQTALHLAAADGNIKAVDLLLKHDEKLLTLTNNRGETPLFLAASFGQTKVVKHLTRKNCEPKKPHVTRKDKTSVLHIAILGEYFETALELLEWADVSPDAVDGNGMTAFHLLSNMPSAFKSGYQMCIFKKLLYYCLPYVDYAENYDEESDRKSQASRNKGDVETGNERENHQPSNQQTANCPSGFSRVYNTIWRRIAKVFPTIQNVWDDKEKHNKAVKLAQTLARTDFTWKHGNYGGRPSGDYISTLENESLDSPAATDHVQRNQGNLGGAPGDEEEKQENKLGARSDQKITTFPIKREKEKVAEKEEEEEEATPYPTPLIAAGKKGILEIVKAILDVYPQAIEHVNLQNENIFHVVANKRRAAILDYLDNSFSNVCNSRMNKTINIKNGDSILHSAAYLSSSSSRDRPGQALLMQSELQWFERIQNIVPKYFINHRNSKQHTAQELFTKEHKQLLEAGQEWLRRTAEACTIVAVLIATVAFTCAYTVPGGSTDTGHPLLLKETPFSVFATSDALSLCFSLTSVVVFLSIMTSKMNEQDFRRSLPLKLVLGLTTLFLSVTFMMVAFSATLMLMIRERLHWAAIPIYTVACFPVTIFLLLQFPLYLNISWFTLKDWFNLKGWFTSK